MTGTVRSELLSCYTTAVAGTLETLGLPHLSIVGGQAFLGVRRLRDGWEVLHYHTPLTGDGRLFEIPLVRRGAASAEEAGRRIADAATRRGVVIVTGSTATLPWTAASETARSEPTPRWFIARPASDPPRLSVLDRFASVDADGEHPPYQGRHDPLDVGRLAASPAPTTPAAANRERWALGTRRNRPEWSETLPWQWLECGEPWTASADSDELLRTMLARTVAGVVVDPRTAGTGWITGPAAIREIRDGVASAGAAPTAYPVHIDLWVAGRTRKLFRRTLGEAGDRALADLGEWVEAALLPAWAALLRALRHHAIRAERGHPPGPGLRDGFDRLAAREQEMIERLDTALSPRHVA